jgi:hypothetical protein
VFEKMTDGTQDWGAHKSRFYNRCPGVPINVVGTQMCPPFFYLQEIWELRIVYVYQLTFNSNYLCKLVAGTLYKFIS